MTKENMLKRKLKMNKKEIKKEIKRLIKFIQVASMENPMNLGHEKTKLSELQGELKCLQ